MDCPCSLDVLGEEVVGGGHHDLDEFSGNCDSCLGVLTALTLLMIAGRRSLGMVMGLTNYFLGIGSWHFCWNL